MELPGGGGMSVKDFLVGLKDEYARDNVGDAAAAVTYAGVLALFPFLLFLVSLASVVIDPQQAESIVTQLGSVAPAQVTQILGDRIRDLGRGSSPGLLTLGALGAIWAASAGIQALMRALNITYGVKEGRPFWKVKLIAIGMTIVAGALALAAAVGIILTPVVADFIGGPVGTAIRLLRFPIAGLVMMFLWAVLYYVLPDVEQKFKFITPGSVGGVVLWVLASWGFSAYVANFGKYDATYGSLGGIIVLLLWMWISSQVMLLGAESNALIEHRSQEGKRAGAKSLADRGPSGAKHEELGPTDARQATSEGQATPKNAKGWDFVRTKSRPLPKPEKRAAYPSNLHRAPKVPGGRPALFPRREGGHPRFDLASIAAFAAGYFLMKRRARA
jgi:membrane protein